MKIKSVLYLLIYALLVASGHILQKLVLNFGVDKFVFAFLRITTGLIFITGLVLYRGYKPVKIIRKNYIHFIVLGAGFSGAGILLKLWGLQHTTATNASFLMSLSSVAVIIFAFIFLGEKTGRGFYTTVFIMIGGIYLVTTGGEQVLPKKGDIIIFCLAFLIGSMRVYGKNVLKKLSVLETAFGRTLFGTIFLFLMIFVFPSEGFSTIPNLSVLLLVLSNGITFSGSILFFYKALQAEGASNSGMFALLVPVFTLGLAGVFLNESYNAWQIFGGVMVLAGSFFISRIKIKQANF
ncbi:MAG: DMT family transporter [Acidobacteriota bacterium]